MKVCNSEIVVAGSVQEFERDLIIEKARQVIKGGHNNTAIDVLILDRIIWVLIEL